VLGERTIVAANWASQQAGLAADAGPRAGNEKRKGSRLAGLISWNKGKMAHIWFYFFIRHFYLANPLPICKLFSIQIKFEF
jgi:hypothetical protein